MAICPSYIGARRMRVTRLDRCGRPVYGPCSQVVSGGFVSIEFSPEVEEGEEYTVRNAAGELCVSEQGPDALRWISVAIEFCNVDAELWQIMNPTWDTVTNAQGETTGFEIGTKFSDEQGFALEVWPKATGQASLCDEDAPEDAAPNGYFLLPYLLGRAPESWTLGNETATFTLNARTKGGSLWGRGPYNITHDAQGNPSPLLNPIDSGAVSGNPKHFHANIVTLPPPEAKCGCQPLEAMAPGAVGGQIEIDPQQANRACFEVSGSPGRRATIDWGDGSDPVTSRVGREECHLYTETGTYTVTVADIDDPAKSNTYEVTITEIPQLPDPVVSHRLTGADYAIQLSVDNHGNGDVIIDWGDDTPTETVPGNGTNGTDPVDYPHQYAGPGTYTITVTAAEDDRAQATDEVSFEAPAPSAPTNPAIDDTATTEDSLTATWDWEQGDGPAASGFQIRYRPAPDGGDPGEWQTPVDINDPAARQGQITGLDAGTRYEAQIRAVTDEGGQSTWTSGVFGTTIEAEPVADPTNPTTSDVTTTGFTLNWEWAQGEGPEATGFEVQHRPTGTTTWNDVPVNDPEARSQAIDGLDPDTEYEARVRAVNADTQSGWTDTVTVTTQAEANPPADPTNVVAAAGAASGELDMTWDWEQGEGPAATGFEARYRTPAGTGDWSDPETIDDPAARDHTFTGLTPDTEYEVGVTAIADTERSGEATATGNSAA